MDLEARVAALEAELAAWRAGERPTAAATPPARHPEASTTRRGLLGRAGIAMAGVAAGLVAGAAPAAADDPDDLTLGAAKTASGPTAGAYTGASRGAAFLFQSGDARTASSTRPDAALVGAAGTGSAAPERVVGVAGLSDLTDGIGVHGIAAGGGGIGLAGEAPGADGAGVVGEATGAGGVGVWAYSARGPALHVALGDAAPVFAPPATGTWQVGDVLRVTSGPHLWYCVGAGTGTDSRWVRLGAGGLNLLAEPQRAYDSRVAGARVAAGDTRTVSLLGAGVPRGAAGALLNLTITDTTGGGYAAVCSAALAAPPATSNVNWTVAAQTVANSATTALDGDGACKVTVVGSPAAVVVDVFGYYD